VHQQVRSLMNIQHSPLFNTEKVEALYTKKDGVEVKYVCTSAVDGGTRALDIFFRATPHPEFGNRYFGLYPNGTDAMITNADLIESLTFAMIEDDGKYYYSQHRHDCKTVGDNLIDGGRAYVRSGPHPVEVLMVKDGKFV
jgi:hypothetical protein